MKVFSTIASLQQGLNNIYDSQLTLGFVPTMGALHQGHLNLVSKSNAKCDITIVSIFVNPTQFNNSEDLKNYPSTIEKDLEKLKSSGCDIVFSPDTEEIYPASPELSITFGEIENALEGKHRPGHFKGVGIIVSKLFNIVKPTHAFFGQKDLQQFFIVNKLISELCFNINLVMVPTVREPNELAMSSRNERLNTKDRENASIIYQSLQEAKDDLIKGETFDMVAERVEKRFDNNPGFNLEYFEMVETGNFQPVSTIDKHTALCIAVNVGNVRLIDNVLLFS